eukprot:3748800-Pyramimonas_sp.AAC.1
MNQQRTDLSRASSSPPEVKRLRVEPPPGLPAPPPPPPPPPTPSPPTGARGPAEPRGEGVTRGVSSSSAGPRRPVQDMIQDLETGRPRGRSRSPPRGEAPADRAAEDFLISPL